MEGFLIKIEGNYYLLSKYGEVIGGTTFTTKGATLSKNNCDELWQTSDEINELKVNIKKSNDKIVLYL